MPGARMMVRGDKGTIFIGTRVIGKVYAVTDKDGKRDRQGDLPKACSSPTASPSRTARSTSSRSTRRCASTASRTSSTAPQPTDISEAIKLPPSTHHNWKFAAVGPDNKLYIAIGSPCNICEINPGMHGQIRRQNLDGSNIEIVARGVRNSVGFDWHPQTKELWFTDNGRDWAGDAGPRTS